MHVQLLNQAVHIQSHWHRNISSIDLYKRLADLLLSAGLLLYNIELEDKYMIDNNEQSTAEELQDNKAYYKAKHACMKLGLNYTFSSIKFVLDTFDISFVQLQTASFWNYDEQRVTSDYIKATIILVQAGLVGSGYNYNTVEELESKSCEIINNWLKKYPIELLFILLNEIIEDRNFFMTSSQLKTMSMAINNKTVKIVAEQTLKTKTQYINLIGELLWKPSMMKYLHWCQT